MSHTRRLQLFAVMHENKGNDVNSIYKKLGLAQSVASQHLAILRKAGIVNTEKRRQSVYYAVNYKRLEEISEIAEKLLRF